MTAHIDSRGMTMREALGAAADRWPDAPLFIAPPEEGRPWDPAGRTVSYAEMQRLADPIAAALHIAGFGPGHRIALDMENRPEHVVWLFAAAAVGVRFPGASTVKSPVARSTVAQTDFSTTGTLGAKVTTPS